MTTPLWAEAPELAGYWPSPWPAEDGGPTRRQAPPVGLAGPGLDLSAGRTLHATTRSTFAPTMCVLREPGEVFLLSHTVGPDTVSWVERIHPESLEPLVRSPDLPAGPFWPGGIAAHADGSLYVTYGRFCHRLDPGTLQPIASRSLPRERPYNSLVVLPGGELVMKDIGGGIGLNRLPDGFRGSELVVLEPGSLAVVARLELPEGSIARLSAIGNDVYAVGVTDCHRVRFDPERATLTRDDAWAPRYRTLDGQTYGWDIVLSAGSGWFLDNGEGSEEFGGCYRGGGKSSAPLHLVRVSLPREGVAPGDDAPATVELVEICGEAGGVVANPPLVDADRGIAVGYDSGHGVMAAWRFGEPGDGFVELWRREQDHAGHLLRWPESGQILSGDFDRARRLDQIVVLDVESGEELARADTASPVQSVLFPAPGWSGDAYHCSLAAVSRVYTD
jgi:hypothetical protein